MKEINLPQVEVTAEAKKRSLPDISQGIKKIDNKDMQSTIDKAIDRETENKLRALLKMSQKDLVAKYLLQTKLQDSVQQSLSQIFGKLDPKKIKDLYADAKLSPEEKQNLALLFKEYEVKTKEEQEKLAEINKVIQETRIALDNFQGQILEQAGYSAETLIKRENGTQKISENELKNLNKILDGDTLVEENLNKTEKKLRKAFRKAVETAGVAVKDFMKIFSDQVQSHSAMPDWKKLFAKDLTDKEVGKIQDGYLAYLEAKKWNPDLSRWNEVVGLLDTQILNQWKNLSEIITETVNAPISKKERKTAFKGQEAKWKFDWINKKYAEEIAKIEAKYTDKKDEKLKDDIVKFCESKDHEAKKAWKEYLKDQEKNWNQKSDLGKFTFLVESLKDQPVDARIRALLTDTNFDGMRNRLDGRGTKRGNQIDQALIMAQADGLTMDKIAASITSYLWKIWQGSGLMIVKNMESTGQAETLYNWMTKSISNAKIVQSALMDSPAEAVDIMRYGADALKQTLEKNKLSPEDMKALQDKINTDPATKDLSEEARESIMNTLSGHLLAKMKEPGVNAGVNGLGVGVNMPLHQVIKGLSLNLGAGATTEWQPFAGVSLAWNHEVAKWKDGNASIGVHAGTNLGVIPVYGFRAGIEQDINAKKVLGSIDPKALKTFSAGANFTMIGAIPSWGVSVGFEKDQLRGIEKQYDHIKKEITPLVEKLLTKDADGKLPDVTTTLQGLFNKSTPQEIQKAAENLNSALKMAQGLDPKQAAQLIGERYAESWRNNAIHGLPKGWKFTGASLGAQFLAGFMPVANLSVTLTKYKNLSHEDTPESKARLRQQIESGIGDVSREGVKAEDFQNIDKQLRAAKILANGEKIEMQKDGSVTLPASLLSKTGLQVRVSEKLKGYLKSKDGQITLPAGISYRFLNAARTNGSTTVLDIGYEKGKMNALTGANLSAYAGEKSYTLDQHINALEGKMKAMNLSNLSIKEGKLYQDGKEIGNLTAESGIKIDQDGKVSLTTEKGTILRESKLAMSANESLNSEVDSVLNPVEKELVAMAHLRSQFDNFKGFLKNAKAMKAEYLAASQDLVKMLADKKFEGLKTALGTNKEGTNFANPHLAYQIMDRLKAVFATIPESQKSTKTAVEKLANQRDSEYKKYHSGKSVLSDFSAGKLDFNYTELAKQLSDNPKSTKIDNLIGFTAFYRRNAWDARGMSMTAFGQTNVLDKTFAVEEEKKSETKSWIIDNLKKQEQQLTLISERIGKIEGLSDGVTKEGFLSKENVLALFDKWTLDIWGKKVTLNATLVKYFLAECANESIGMQIDGVQVVDTTTVNVAGGSMTYNLSDTMAKANIQQQKVTLGVAFGGGKKEEAKKERKDGKGESNPNQWDSPDVRVNPDKTQWDGASKPPITKTQDVRINGATDE